MSLTLKKVMAEKCRAEKYLRLIAASLGVFFEIHNSPVVVLHFSVIAFVWQRIF
jgi:hypothetical protein